MITGLSDTSNGERIGPYELLARTCRVKGWRLALYSSRQSSDDVGTGPDTLAVYNGPMMNGATMIAQASCRHVSELDAVAELLLEGLVRQGHLKLEVS